jgi:general secretion pathway protein K
MKPSPRPRRHRGIALMAVIWLVGILAIACMATLRVVSFDMDLASSKIHGSRARQIAEMGIAVGSNPVIERGDPLLKWFDEEFGEGFEVELISEGGRFNINAVLLRGDKNLVRSIFTTWGIDLDTAQAIADALSDWVDADDEVALNGAEEAWYRAQGRLNQPFNRPFYDLSEMRLVRDMEIVEAINPNWRDWFTVYSFPGQLDLNEAEAELISEALEVSVEMASIIPQTVRGPDGIRGTTDDVPFQDVNAALALVGLNSDARPDLAQRVTVNDTTTRIQSTGYSGGSKRRINVIVRNRTGRPALLERTEEIIP